jgi:hypothetical protein
MSEPLHYKRSLLKEFLDFIDLIEIKFRSDPNYDSSDGFHEIIKEKMKIQLIMKNERKERAA